MLEGRVLEKQVRRGSSEWFHNRLGHKIAGCDLRRRMPCQLKCRTVSRWTLALMPQGDGRSRDCM